MKSTLAAVKRQRFPSQASRRVHGLFILGLGLVLKGLADLGKHITFDGHCRLYLVFSNYSDNVVLISVTRFGDLLDFGHLFMPLAAINLPQPHPFLGNFKGVKIIHFSSETIFGKLL